MYADDVVLLSNSREDIQIGDKFLTISNSVSYLGLVLSCSGKFSQTQSNLADRRLKAVNYLMTLMNYMLQTPIFSVLCLINLHSQ